MNNNPTLKEILPQLQAWCAVNNISVQSVYDACHGMTMQELVYYLFSVVQQTAGEVVEYQTAFDDLKNFVDNYFTNLDVQKEINNKLDEMASDGTLEKLISLTLKTYYTPQMFGGVGDGITDDTNAIQTCIAQAITDKMPVLIPNGKYLVTDTINIQNSVLITGCGFNSEILTNKNIDILSCGSDNMTEQITIKNLKLTSEFNLTSKSGITAKNLHNAIFYNLYILNCAQGLVLNTVKNSLIDFIKIVVDNSKQIKTGELYGIITGNDCTSTTFENITITFNRTNEGVGVYLGSGNINDEFFRNLDINSVYTGITILGNGSYGTDIVFENTRIDTVILAINIINCNHSIIFNTGWIALAHTNNQRTAIYCDNITGLILNNIQFDSAPSLNDNLYNTLINIINSNRIKILNNLFYNGFKCVVLSNVTFCEISGNSFTCLDSTNKMDTGISITGKDSSANLISNNIFNGYIETSILNTSNSCAHVGNISEIGLYNITGSNNSNSANIPTI